MDFQTFAVEELSSLAVRLSDAAAEEREEATRDLVTSHATTIAELTGAHHKDVHDLEAAHDAAIAQLSSGHQATIDDLLASHRLSLEAARSQVDGATIENEQLSAQLAVLTAEQEARARTRANDGRGQTLQRLLAAFDGIARSATVNEVLVAGARGLADEFTRVAVFIVNADRLEVQHHHGFDTSAALHAVTIPRDADSIVARALHRPDVQCYGAGDLHDERFSPFPGSPHVVVTAPIAVRGETMAVLYADDEGGDAGATEEDLVALTSILQHHAALRLERLTIELKAIAELRAYARMLLDEVEYVYQADASAGKPEQERLEHLQENLRCGRQIYRQRITLEGPAAASLLEDIITDTLTGKSGTPFANDLGTVLLQGDAEPASTNNAA